MVEPTLNSFEGLESSQTAWLGYIRLINIIIRVS
jgi:hypothetical protein